MKGKTMERIESVSVLVVACYRIAEVLHVDTYLVLPACLQSHLRKGEASVGGNTTIVGDGLLAAIVCGTAIGYIGFVVL